MTYLVFAAAYFVIFGWRPFILCLDFTQLEVREYIYIYIYNMLMLNYLLVKWPYYFPRALMAFSIILSICMGLAIGALCIWHYYLASSSTSGLTHAYS